jgi:hypothetical protein
MNKENVDFLKDRLFFLGFGDKLNAELEKKMEGKADKFNLNIQGEFGKDEQKKVVDYTLDFSKSKERDMYFLNNYSATLKSNEPEKERTQKFYLNNGSGVTAKEAFNLLEGRAVFKNKLFNRDDQQYSAWLQLNFNEKNEQGNFKQQQFHTNWKYDLDKSVNRHPVKELNDPTQKADLIKSLEKGNVQSVTFVKEDKETKMFLEANPKERNVIVYDENMKKQFQGIKQSKTEGKTEDQSQGVDARGADGKDQKENAKASQKQDNEPPGKSKKKKGMSV